MLNKVLAFSLGFMLILVAEHKNFKVRTLFLAYTIIFLALLGTIQLISDNMGG